MRKANEKIKFEVCIEFWHMERSRQNDVVFLVFAKTLKGLEMLLFKAKRRQRFIEFHVIKVKLTIQRLTQWNCQVGTEADIQLVENQ